MKNLVWAICTAMILATAAYCQAPSDQPLVNESIVGMVQAGLPEEIIITKIQTSPNNFDLSTTGLVFLSKERVSNNIMKAMMGASSNSLKPSSDSGQEVKNVQEPEYVHVIVYLDPAGVLVPLEKQTKSTDVKTKFGGLGGIQTAGSYKGAKSPVRFKEGQDIQFVVRRGMTAPGYERDPEGTVIVTPLKVSKDQRLELFFKSGAMFVGRGTKQETPQQPRLKYSKYGEQSLKFSPVEPLAPGEYAMTTGGTFSSFLFGVDPK